ncbi:MAG: AraC family transcriptional regulator ligand-binding domain-containing protein [Aquabacterium sp.]|nr:AraC family transcriptional regulator ligand-binding domain-containing protein [Aquabacterium sp.]
MSAMLRCYDGTTPLIPSLHQPALLCDLAAARDLDLAPLLAGLPLRPANFEDAPVLLSPAGWLALLDRAGRALAAPDIAFALGRRMLPGHYGAASQALAQSANLRQALEVLVRHPARLSTLLVPRLVIENDVAVLVFTDAVGLGALRPFVVDMTMTAVSAMVQWLAGERAPWTFCFNRAAPRLPEQHEAYLGSALRFGCLVDAMLVPTAWLDRPWPQAASVDAAVSRLAALRAAAHEGHPERSLLALVHDHLLDTLRASPGLDAAAQALGTSAATLKRRLAAEGTHFQAELDLVRSHVALLHYRFRSADNAAVAKALGFGDVPNFRRSFKRWTGLTPQLLRPSLLST